jgi:hypothetical protein
MLVIEGFLEKGQFIPDSPVDLPGKAKAFLTIEQDRTTERERNRTAWGEFLEAIKNAENEELIGVPERLKFKTPEEIDLL